MSTRGKAWLLCAVAGVMLIVLCLVLVWVGLETADKLGSVLGALCGLAGLALNVWGLVLARRREPGGARISAEGTGCSESVNGGSAVSGVVIEREVPGGTVTASETGDASAEGDGDATSGVRVT